MFVVPGPIYRQSVPSMNYQFSQFIGRPCHNSRMEWANLSAKRANYTRFLANLLANQSQKVKCVIYIIIINFVVIIII